MAHEKAENGNGNGNGVFVKFIIGTVMLLLVSGIGTTMYALSSTGSALAELKISKADVNEQTKVHSDIETRLRLLENNFVELNTTLKEMKTDSKEINGKLDRILDNRYRSQSTPEPLAKTK